MRRCVLSGLAVIVLLASGCGSDATGTRPPTPTATPGVSESPDDTASTHAIDEALSGVTIESWVDPQGGLRCLRLGGTGGSVDGRDLCALADQPTLAAMWPAATNAALVLLHVPPGWSVETFKSRGDQLETTTRRGVVIGLVPTSSGDLITFELGGTDTSNRRFECAKGTTLNLECQP